MSENNFFEKLCWVCLAEESNMQSLIDKDKKIEFENIKDSVSLYDLLSYVISTNIFYVDGPHLICNNCKIQACAAYKFKKRCDVSSNIFQQCGLIPCNDDKYCTTNKLDHVKVTEEPTEDIKLSEEAECVKQEVIKIEDDLVINEDIIFEDDTVFEIVQDDLILINDEESMRNLIHNQRIPIIDKEYENEIATVPIPSPYPKVSSTLPYNWELPNDTLLKSNRTETNSIVLDIFNEEGQSSNSRSTNRKRSEKDTCLFCKNQVSNFARHLLRHHSLENEVKAIRSTPIESFEALDSDHYPAIVEATKIIGQYDKRTTQFNSPTYVLNIGNALNRCCDIAINCTQNTEGISDEVKSKLGKIQAVFYSNWKEDISSQALLGLNLRWNDVTLVSLATDLKILIDYVTIKANNACLQLLSNQNLDFYTELMETVFCRIALLNRKHYVTLQRLSWTDYETLQEDDQTCEATSLSQKILHQNFKKLCMKDKCGFSVTIYISCDVYEHIKVLNELRSNLVNVSNTHLFVNSNCPSLMFGNKILVKYAKESGVKDPLAIVCTRFRNNIQILAQLIFLKENEMEGLKQFFHRKLTMNEKTQQSTDHIDNMITISKGLLTEDDVTHDVTLTPPTNDEETNPGDNVENSSNGTCEISCPNIVHVTRSKSKLMDSKLKIQRTPWTSEQKRVVMSFFKDHIKFKNPPKRRECDELISMHPNLLKNKIG